MKFMIEDYVEMPIRNMNIDNNGVVLVQLADEYDSETMEEIKNHWQRSDKYMELKKLGFDVQLTSEKAVSGHESFSITKELL